MDIKNNNLISLSIYLKKYRLKLFCVFLALLLSACSVLSIGITIRYFVNYGFESGDTYALTKIAIVFVIILLVLAIASAVRSYLINMVSENVVVDIKRDIYQRLISMRIFYFETHNITDVVSRLLNDTQLIQNVINSVFSFFIRNTIMMIGGIILLFITNVMLTIYTICAIPIIIVPIIILAKKVRVTSKNTQEKLSNMGSHIEETLSGIKTVQANNAEKYEIKNFISLTEDYMKAVGLRGLNRSLLVGLVMAVVSISTLTVLWIGGQYVIKGEMSSGELVSFIFYSIVVASSVGGMSEVIGDISRASGAAERILELYALENVSTNSKHMLKLGKVPPSIEFDNVFFSYPGRIDTEIIRELSFTINPGDKVALVGKSGSGKSTIVSLLLKFYAPLGGKITIAGKDIQELATEDVRNKIGVVSQETFIFSNTVAYNISYGKENISRAAIMKAATAANIHDFIMSLPRGYDTFLGEKGSQLSSGQKQRLAIARIILKDPEILILDEATSNLDEANAAAVQQALDSIMKNRTTLVVSHRASALSACNKVISL